MRYDAPLNRRVLLALMPLALALALAACGSASPKANKTAAKSPSTTPSGAAAGRAGFLRNDPKLAACLKSHGVTLPTFHRPANGGAPPAGGGFFGGGGGAPGGGFARNPKLRSALQACGAHFPAGGRFRAGGFRQSAAFKQRLGTFVACVKQHGYDLPKPNLSGKGAVFPVSVEHNAKFLAAAKPCESLLSFRRPAAGTSTTG
jgi:hypothetical protein